MASYVSATGTGTNTPTFTTTKNSVNSIVFSAWAPWSMTIPVDQQYRYYMSAPLQGHLGTTIAATTYPFSDEMRQNFIGCLNVQCNSTSASLSGARGQLFWEQTLDLSDFTPIATGVAIPYTLLQTGMAMSGLSLTKSIRPEEKKEAGEPFVMDCDDDGSTVVLPAVPSSVKGHSSIARYLPDPGSSLRLVTPQSTSKIGSTPNR